MTENSFETTTAIDDISGDYVLDTAHTRLGFAARHAMVTNVRGSFKEFEGTAHVDTANPANSQVSIKITANSIDTGNKDRDGHLLSGDFFETETNPFITFVSSNVDFDGETWEITGDLTIKGVTQKVTIPFEQTGSAQDPYGNTRVGFEGSTTINRTDFGLTFNAPLGTGGVLVSEKIKLDFDISAIKQG
ncbi:YceI family protein [Nocardioides sp. Kera G14]|uniref:YceI family protein n=1 Tax=Nocardioides sp. Kera G14 TaxID=2884264 RepID=UPI001D1136D2|nr:YceI family protein [Nocardioides sp. Kera G14]UDY23520.1 YceI family protein [Nocardioides sp. Kera G14]